MASRRLLALAIICLGLGTISVQADPDPKPRPQARPRRQQEDYNEDYNYNYDYDGNYYDNPNGDDEPDYEDPYAPDNYGGNIGVKPSCYLSSHNFQTLRRRPSPPPLWRWTTTLMT